MRKTIQVLAGDKAGVGDQDSAVLFNSKYQTIVEGGWEGGASRLKSAQPYEVR